MARVMKGADLGITSNGRTVYELAAMGVPMISISQNERETLHLFARYSRGVRYLGPSSVTPEEIQNTVLEIASETNMRRELYDNLPIKELRSGLPRLAKLIESEYKRWRDEKYSNR
jgi:spore coat polysaccharide biosynthesis predicted glycosyltransferase SpsG